MTDFKEMASKIWSVADLLRGDYKQPDYWQVRKPERKTLGFEKQVLL